MIEPEIMAISRAFPESQRLLDTVPGDNLGVMSVGWHDTVLSSFTGAAALVRLGGPLEERVGEIMRVTADSGAQCLVYVVGAADVERNLSLARRAFLAVCPLAQEDVDLLVEAGG